jgi:hypothetical protein
MPNYFQRFLKPTTLLIICFISLHHTNTNAARSRSGEKQAEFFLSLGNSNYSFENDYSADGHLGYSVGASIAFFNKDDWGFKTGLMYSLYQTTIMLDGETFSTPSIDSEDYNFNLLSSFSNFKENVKTSYIQVPIAVQYRYEISDNFGLLPELGTMLFLSLGSSSEITEGTYSTAGAYPDLGEFTILEGMPGSGTYSHTQTEQYNNWNWGASLFGSVQAYYSISKQIMLTGGFTFDYQLSPSSGNKNTSLVDYEITSYKTATCNYNPLLSTEDAGNYRKTFVGLKLGLIYKLK